MAISFEIPANIERDLAGQVGDISQAAKEALVIESYRTGKLSIGQVASILGFENRFQAEEWLGRHGVAWNYSPEDLDADRRTLRSVLGGDR